MRDYRSFSQYLLKQNNNNQSQNEAIDCSSCYHFGFLKLNKMTKEENLKAKSIVFSYESKIIDKIKCNHSYDKLKISMAKGYNVCTCGKMIKRKDFEAE